VAGDDFLYEVNAGLTARSGRRIAATARSGRFAPCALDRAAAAQPKARSRDDRHPHTGRWHCLADCVDRFPQFGSAATMPGVAEDRTPSLGPTRTLFAVLAVVSAAVAVAGVVLQNWLTVIGSSLTAVAMAGSFWNTRPRRAN